MTTTQQPEALRVAAWLITAPQSTTIGDMLIAGRELRRLHARVVELEEELQLANQSSGAEAYDIACEEMGAFQKKRAIAGKEVGTQGSLVDGMAWVYGELDKAESQLEAIGAGGVESTQGSIEMGECVGCGHLYEKPFPTQCDCLNNPANKYKPWRAHGIK